MNRRRQDKMDEVPEKGAKMKNRKWTKLAVSMLAIIMVLETAGCGRKQQEPEAESQTATEAVSEEQTEQGSSESTTEAGTAEEGTTENTAGSLSELAAVVKEAYGQDYMPDTILDAEMINNMYGIPEDLYEEAYVEIPAISVHVDTFMAFKCKEGKQAELTELVTAYQNRLKEDTMQYPSNQLIIQSSSIVEKDPYVFFIMLGTIPTEVEEQGDDAVLKKAEENNEIAKKAIEAYFQG